MPDDVDREKLERFISHPVDLTDEDLAGLPGVRSLDEIRAALRKEKDPKRQDELLAELFEAMDEYSMDVAEAAWETQDIEAETSSKSLSPRNLPPEDAAAGVRAAEDDLMGRLSNLIDRAMKAMRRRRGVSQQQVGETLADVMTELRAAFLEEGLTAVRGLYQLGRRAERSTGPMSGKDESIVRFLQAHPDELAGQLSRVVADETGILAKVVRESLANGIDTAKAIDKAMLELDEARWKVERVVRTATSSIVNKGRIAQIEMRGPDVLVDLIVSKDERTCPECLEAETHNPWTIPDARARTKGRLTFHLDCRCTWGRHVA